MITFFRSFFNSKIGLAFTFLFIGLIAIAFVSSDLSNSNGLNSLTGGGAQVAKVGGESLPGAELQSRTQRVFEQERRENVGLTMSTFISAGGVENVLAQLLSGLTVMEFGKDQGLAISKRLEDAQIAAIPAFQDASGKFSQDVFRQLLAREGISEAALRQDIRRDLMTRQLLGPAAFGNKLGDSMILPYASLLLESRNGRVAAIPAESFIDTAEPSAKELAEFYAKNEDNYIIPEQRRLRYAVIDLPRFEKAAVPTEAEISRYYTDNAARYAARETRSFEQLILPTQAAANSIAAAVKGGKTLAEAAQAAGLSAANVAAIDRTALSTQSSEAVAKAGFEAAKGTMTAPVKGTLGWYVLRVVDVTSTPKQELAQIKPQIVEALRAEKAQKLLSDFTAKVEDQIADGGTFDEVIKDNGLAIQATPLLLKEGRSIADPSYQASPELAPLLTGGFAMELDEDPQLVAITPNARYALIDVADIKAAAPPPLNAIRQVVVQQFQLARGNAKAKTFTEALMTRIGKGEKFDAVMRDASTKAKLPAPAPIGGRRADLARDGQRVPPPLALLFSMAEGSTKKLEIGQDRGWFIVTLDQIQRGDAGKQPALIDVTRRELSQVAGNEYAAQFERAIEKQLGVTRDDAAIASTKQALRVANGGSAQ